MIDGVAAAVKFVESLVWMGVGTSKVGDLAWPLPKAYTGAMAHLAPGGWPVEQAARPRRT